MMSVDVFLFLGLFGGSGAECAYLPTSAWITCSANIAHARRSCFLSFVWLSKGDLLQRPQEGHSLPD